MGKLFAYQGDENLAQGSNSSYQSSVCRVCILYMITNIYVYTSMYTQTDTGNKTEVAQSSFGRSQNSRKMFVSTSLFLEER